MIPRMSWDKDGKDYSYRAVHSLHGSISFHTVHINNQGEVLLSIEHKGCLVARKRAKNVATAMGRARDYFRAYWLGGLEELKRSLHVRTQ